MSGSRRHRVNLNAQVTPARPPQRQVSQPQPAPVPTPLPPRAPIAAPTQHQFLSTAPVNMPNLPQSHVQTVQNVHRHLPQPPTPSMVQHRPQIFAVPTHPSFAQSTTPSSAQFTQSPVAQPRPVVSTSDGLIDRLMSSLNPVLAAHQESNFARMEKLESSIETLANQIKDIRSDSEAQRKTFAEALQKSFIVQQSGSQVLSSRMERLEKTIGASFDRDDNKSLLNRLDNISFAVEELLERAKDPDALLSEFPVSDQTQENNPYIPQKQSRDVGIDSRTPPPRTPPPPAPVSPTRVEFGTSPVRLIYAEVAVNPQTPRPEPEPELPTRCEMGTSPVRHTYLDVGIDPPTPLPEYPSEPALIHREVGTSPRRQIYLETGTSARTPEPQRSPRVFVSAGVATSPTPERFFPGMLSSRRFSSDAITLVGDISCPEIKSTIDFESPKTANIKIRPGERTPEKDLPGIEGSAPSSPETGIQSHFASVPSVSKPMSPVDWSRNDDNGVSSDEESDDEVVPVFRPDSSPEKIRQFSLLKTKEITKSPEGTIAALREEAFGESFTGPVASSPRPPVAPFHSRPSVSPLPSPAHTPSPSPFRKHTYTLPAAQGSRPSHESPAPDIPESLDDIQSSFSAAYPTTDIAQSLDDPIQSSFTDNSLPKQVPPSTLDQIQSSFPSDSPAPDSEDDSELSVTRLITETFANLEEPFPESCPPSLPPSRTHTPLFTRPSESPPRPSPPPKVAGVKRRKAISLSRSVSSVANVKNERLASTKPRPKPPPVVKPSQAKPSMSTPSAAPKATFVQSSPIYISSRSPSPLSELTSEDEGSDADSDVRIVPAKKKVKTEKKDTGSVAASANESQSQPPPQRKKVLNLKTTQPGKSAAVTRVKKRKANPLEVMEPPLKRARQKEEDSAKGSSKASSKGNGVKEEKEKISTARGKGKEKSGASTAALSSSKGKAREKRSSSQAIPGVKWPKKAKDGNSKFNMTFIECDGCFLWYHYGCVGIVPDDVRTNPGEIFTCPPCTSNGANALVGEKGNPCARPDCPHKQKQPDEFFVSGIVGRATKVQGGQGRSVIVIDD